MNQYFKHPTALVESEQIGNGTRIWAFAHIVEGAKIGQNCNIGDHCFIEDGVAIADNVTIKNQVSIWKGVSISDGVFVGPNVTFTNDLRPRSRNPNWVWLRTSIGEGATLGANATILCGITVGQYAFVGAGAVVTKDVPAYTVVKGNPARIGGYICQCTAKIKLRTNTVVTCPDCRLRYRKSRGGGVTLLSGHSS